MNQQFYRTSNQVAFNAKEEIGDDLKHKNNSPFAFARYKLRAASNYDSELRSKNAVIDNRVQNFNSRISVGKGEHDLPGSQPKIKHANRFGKMLQPYEDI